MLNLNGTLVPSFLIFKFKAFTVLQFLKNPVFSIKFGDWILSLCLAFEPDTICYFKFFLKIFWPLFFGFLPIRIVKNKNIIRNLRPSFNQFNHLYKVLIFLKNINLKMHDYGMITVTKEFLILFSKFLFIL